jgi:hypothetical protein
MSVVRKVKRLSVSQKRALKKRANAEYRRKNRSKIAKLKAEYYRNNASKIAKRGAEYYRKNRSKIAKRVAEYRRNNRSKIAKYLHKNRSKIAKRGAEYRRTWEGMIISMYGSMNSRVNGHSKARVKYYGGRYLPTREQFIEFSKNSLELYRLWKQWVQSGYQIDLKPSPDRIITKPDPNTGFTGGYELHNIQFVTWKMNREMANHKRAMNNKAVVYDLIGKSLNVPGRDKLDRRVSADKKQAIYDLAAARSKKNVKKAA